MDEAELIKQPSDVTECPYKKGSFNHPDKVIVCVHIFVILLYPVPRKQS